MAHTPEEWLRQAEEDMATAEYMSDSERYVYAVFFAHLAIEKALKGIYHKKFCELPPKTHSLSWLVKHNGLTPTESMEKFIVGLDYASIATRYPEELKKVQLAYPRSKVEGILKQTKEVLIWVKKMF